MKSFQAAPAAERVVRQPPSPKSCRFNWLRPPTNYFGLLHSVHWPVALAGAMPTAAAAGHRTSVAMTRRRGCRRGDGGAPSFAGAWCGPGRVAAARGRRRGGGVAARARLPNQSLQRIRPTAADRARPLRLGRRCGNHSRPNRSSLRSFGRESEGGSGPSPAKPAIASEGVFDAADQLPRVRS